MGSVHENIKIQESVEGDTENIRLLKIIVQHTKFHGDFLSLVDVKHHRTGKRSYDCDIFYYVKPSVKEMVIGLYQELSKAWVVHGDM